MINIMCNTLPGTLLTSKENIFIPDALWHALLCLLDFSLLMSSFYHCPLARCLCLTLKRHMKSSLKNVIKAWREGAQFTSMLEYVSEYTHFIYFSLILVFFLSAIVFADPQSPLSECGAFIWGQFSRKLRSPTESLKNSWIAWSLGRKLFSSRFLNRVGWGARGCSFDRVTILRIICVGCSFDKVSIFNDSLLYISLQVCCCTLGNLPSAFHQSAGGC